MSRIGFVFSVAAITFLLGYVTRWHNWYPDKILEAASKQATTLRKHFSDEPVLLTDRVYDHQGARTVQPEAMQPGLTMIASVWKHESEWNPGLRLIDRTGQTVHHWEINKEALFPDSLNPRASFPATQALHGTHLRPNGDILINLADIGTVRLDACGRIKWRLEKGGHHAISPTEEGSFWIPGVDYPLRHKSTKYPEGYPGLDHPAAIETALHVSDTGELLNKINLLDVLYQNGLERYLAKAFQPQAGAESPLTSDLIHSNDVEPLPPSMAEEYPLFEAGDLLVSLRDPQLVFVFDPDTGNAKWHTSEPFIQQHDPDFIGNGWIGVFDNNEDFTSRGTMLGGTRIVGIQPHSDSIEVFFPTSHSDAFYTDVRGKWQMLDNGNMLLAETQTGRVVEVDSTGRTVWEWVQPPYNRSKVPAVTKAARHDLTREDVAAWPCSSVDSSNTRP